MSRDRSLLQSVTDAQRKALEGRDKRIAELQAENARLRGAITHAMKSCLLCHGKIKYTGKDFEELECRSCKALKEAGDE